MPKKQVNKSVKKPAQKLEFTIDRSRWYRGQDQNPEGSRLSALLIAPGGERGSQGKMCCLGFLSLACGLKKKDIRGLRVVQDIEDVPIPAPMEFLVRRRGEHVRASRAGSKLMTLNDNGKISDEKRERLLTAEFAAKGIEVEFVN